MQRGSLKVKKRPGIKVWQLQWRENGHGRTRTLGLYSTTSRAEADGERRRIMAAVNATAHASHTSAVTVRRFVEDEYLTVKTRIWKASTRGTTEQIIEAHVLREIGDRAIASVTRKELQALLDQKAEASLSSSVVGHIRWQLVAIFGMARADGLTTIDPAEELVTPICKDAGEKRIIDPDAIRRAEMVLDIRERLVFDLAVRHGMRPGEIVGLQIGDIEDGLINVRRRVYRGILDSPKSRKSRRPIPLMAKTRALLDRWLEIVPSSADGWLFPSETADSPMSYSNIYRRNIRPALKKVGLASVNFQILRRTWVNEFSQAEKDPAVRAQLAGHSVDVHENEYRQPQTGVLKRAMKKLERRLQ